MKKAKKSLSYTPPCFSDISTFAASGQLTPTPEGSCASGNSPFYSCVAGPDFLGSCAPGTTPDTSACNAGSVHSRPACDAGAKATTDCWSGYGQQ